MQNKRGQVGDTLTWIVATIIIVGLLVFFTFGAATFASTKNLARGFKSTVFSSSQKSNTDIIVQQSVYTYLQTKNEDTQREIKKLIDSSNSVNGTLLFNQIEQRSKLK